VSIATGGTITDTFNQDTSSPNLITATSGWGGDMTNHPSQPAPQPDVTPGPTRHGGRGRR
jgi:hypothetical protein